ncbi:MAG: hypothetical protein ACP5D6_05110 [Kosmotogaceae bacterium]
MKKQDNFIGFVIAIIGGFGLGLLLGSEFSGTTITILGAVLLVFTIISIIFLSTHKEK